jgi:hypothetical protein
MHAQVEIAGVLNFRLEFSKHSSFFQSASGQRERGEGEREGKREGEREKERERCRMWLFEFISLLLTKLKI